MPSTSAGTPPSRMPQNEPLQADQRVGDAARPSCSISNSSGEMLDGAGKKRVSIEAEPRRQLPDEQAAPSGETMLSKRSRVAQRQRDGSPRRRGDGSIS